MNAPEIYRYSTRNIKRPTEKKVCTIAKTFGTLYFKYALGKDEKTGNEGIPNGRYRHLKGGKREETKKKRKKQTYRTAEP